MPILDRTDKINSIADLPGSLLLIYLNPGFFTTDLHNMDLQLEPHLSDLLLVVNGVSYIVNLGHAETGTTAMLRWYAVMIPAGSDIHDYLVPQS
jgi:hypothetical protein